MALYRKYRPATFAQVVGQKHVTEPLSTALDNGKINHAYLFSGPRGCGKTSSARILARSLNCVEGPTSTPCGVCDSCISLAPGGSGNLDVTELDAATHNGVDDMRELRERAFYAPAESRYRVFIIDEAHMISSAGFNALLKIVEEPPEHLIFIFATTEPEKLLATIRSRTHNYPFRLLAPPDMRQLLTSVVTDEGVDVAPEVYPLVIRAGGGSPRDSLSIMDQLLAGAGPDGVTYERAVGLLGVTDSALLDRAVEALATHDSAALFGVVDDVIEAGYDPRRFAEDLLDRFRDLLVLQSVPDAFTRGLVNAPEGERDGLTNQAQNLGQAALTRCAALVNEGLAQMRGATSPRLLLEILCARMALPAAALTMEALAQRIEALEGGRVVATAAKDNAETQPARPSDADTPAKAGSSMSSGKVYQRPNKRSAEATEPVDKPTSTADGPLSPQRIAGARDAREILERNRPAPAPTPASQAEPTEPTAPTAPTAPTEPRPAEPAPEREPESKQPEPQLTVAEAWPLLLESVQEHDPAAWIVLRMAAPASETATAPFAPASGDGGDEDSAVVIVDHRTKAMASFINQPERQRLFAAAAKQRWGFAVRVEARHRPPRAGKSGNETKAASSSASRPGGPNDAAEGGSHPAPPVAPASAPSDRIATGIPGEYLMSAEKGRQEAESALAQAQRMTEALTATASTPLPAPASKDITRTRSANGAQGNPDWREKVANRRAQSRDKARERWMRQVDDVPLPEAPPDDDWQPPAPPMPEEPAPEQPDQPDQPEPTQPQRPTQPPSQQPPPPAPPAEAEPPVNPREAAINLIKDKLGGQLLEP